MRTHSRRGPGESVTDAADATEWLDLMTPDEVAAALKKTRKAVYAMLERGLLPAPVRVGRRVLFRRVDMVGYLRERLAASPGGDG